MNRRFQIGMLCLAAWSALTVCADSDNHSSRSFGTYAYIVKVQPNSTESLIKCEGPGCPFYVIYQGKLMLLHGKVAVLKKRRQSFVFSVIITADVEYTAYAGGGIALKRDEPVRWFDVTFVWTGTKWICEIDELSHDRMSQLLPDHALVLLYDPSLVKTLRQPVRACYCRDSAYEGGCCTFELPIIELQGSAKEHAAAHARVEAALPGIRLFNKQVSSVVQMVECGYCSLHID